MVSLCHRFLGTLNATRNWVSKMMNFDGKSLVVVAPHCDDEVLGAGGTLAKYAEAGWQTSFIYVTKPSPKLASE